MADNDPTPEFADDLLSGAAEIAKFLFGDEGLRRKVYYLVAIGRLPVFHLGSAQIYARKSVLRKYVVHQEQRAWKSLNYDPGPDDLGSDAR